VVLANQTSSYWIALQSGMDLLSISGSWPLSTL
jgi:hypothetical protein